jgi:tetratricopeptide (TPR) repeat protein
MRAPYTLLLALCLPLLPAAGALADLGAAAALLRGGDHAGAQRAASALLVSGTDTGRARVVLGQALEARGEVAEARAAYAAARDDDDRERLDALQAGARLQQLYDGDEASARAVMQQVLASYRADVGRLDVAQRIAAGDAARALARRNPELYRTALDIYEGALARAEATQDVPAQVAAQVALGELLLHRFNNAEALEAFRAALVLDAQDPQALLGLARSMHFDGASGAEEAVGRVLAVNARHTGALALLATLQIESEDYDAAAQTVARGLAVNPRSPPLLTRAAALRFLAGDEAGFEERVEALRRQAPGHHALYETLAEIAAQVRRYERAARFALVAVTLDSESWRGHALLGTNRLRLGDMDSGRRSLEIAFRGDPYDPYTKNALELLDRLDGYRQVRSRRFVLVAEPGEADILGELLLPIAEEAYDFFAEAYGYEPPTPVRIEFYPRHEDFSVRTVGMVGIDIVGVSFGPVVAMDSPSAGVFGPLNFGSVLWHELAHTFHLGMTGARVPRWFSEGLAVFEERRARLGWGNDASAAFVGAWARGELPRPSRLNQTFLRPSTPQVLLHGYYQASLLMELIAREHGFEAIVGMLRSYAAGGTTAQAIRDALGREPEDLDTAFDAFMHERFAAMADALGVEDAAIAGGGSGDGAYPGLLQQAAEAMRAERYQEAKSLLEKAQELLPQLAGSEGSYRPLAEVYEKLGELDAAIGQLQRHIAIDADDIDAHRALAALHERRGEAAAAVGVLQRSLLIQPFEIDGHRRLADLLEGLDEWSTAVGARSAVVSLDDTDPAGSRYLLARAHLKAGDREDAREQVLRSLEAAPMYGDALELLLRIRESGPVPDVQSATGNAR